jgi:hypothetical protein
MDGSHGLREEELEAKVDKKSAFPPSFFFFHVRLAILSITENSSFNNRELIITI